MSAVEITANSDSHSRSNLCCCSWSFLCSLSFSLWVLAVFSWYSDTVSFTTSRTSWTAAVSSLVTRAFSLSILDIFWLLMEWAVGNDRRQLHVQCLSSMFGKSIGATAFKDFHFKGYTSDINDLKLPITDCQGCDGLHLTFTYSETDDRSRIHLMSNRSGYHTIT